MPLSKEQFNELRSKGLTVDQIVRFEKGEKPQQQEKPGFFKSLIKGETPEILEQKGITDPFAFPRGAARLGLETAKEVGRIGATPIIEGVRGLQGAIPGGKTGEEPINVPGLGGFKPLTPGGALIKAGETTALGLAGPITKRLGKPLRRLGTYLRGRKGAKALSQVEDIISPQLTKRETQLASQQDRIIRTPETLRTKVFGKKPDTVLQSNSVKKSAQTVNGRIPGADKLDDQVLNTKIKAEISSISNNLKPNLKTINVAPEQAGKVKSAWSKLKKKQAGDAELSTVPGFNKTQANFESFLNEIDKSVKDAGGQFRQKNLDDIWNIRKDYDNSIKLNIKEADSLSESSLQFKKDMWIDNRRILNDIVEEMSEDLEITSKQAFNEMSDLYRARQNIIGKTKVEVKGKPGLLSWKNALRAGLVGTGGTIFYKLID